MAWTAPITFVSNTVLTAAQLNTYLRDNMNETCVAKATTPGSHFVTTGPNAIAERQIKGDFINTVESTTETDYTDLATIGPQVTVETGINAIVMMSVQWYSANSNTATRCGFEVSGATSIEPSDAYDLVTDGVAGGESNRTKASGAWWLNTLTPGTNTFTMKYKASTTGAKLTVRERHLIVIAL